jgi:Mg2+ and Co2+ transporter CorA
LVTLKNRAAQTTSACRSMVSRAEEAGIAPDAFVPLIDRFERLRDLCDGEADFVRGVLDFYQSRVNTKMNIAMERLALIAAVTIPITAIGTVYGMNIIGRGAFDPVQLAIVLTVMLVCVLALFRWAKRQGWW